MNEDPSLKERDNLLEVARDLNILVVSLDRLGSAHADRDQRKLADALLQFVEEWSVFDKLAQAREVVDAVVLATAKTPEEVAEIEKQFDSGPYWTAT